MKRIYEIILIIGLLIVSGVAHGINMFEYPYFENDEGAYMSQAWSLVTTGDLAPYTYWYDHAPFGWIFIAGWAIVTGGFFAFGDPILSGRIMMLVLHVLSTLFIYFITRRLSKSPFAATLASLIFALSPLGIYFQRRVLLDNIMIFWILASFAILMVQKLKLRHVFASGLMCGFAILSKENAVFFVPAFLLAVFMLSHASHRLFAMMSWLAMMGSFVLMYPLYALIKSEFFPSPTGEHVSLLGTLAFHASRGTDFPFWHPSSEFHNAFIAWIEKDPFTIAMGAFCSIVVVAFAFWHKPFRIPAAFTLLSWAFLLRGGLILEFYVVALLPFLAICIGMVMQEIVRTLGGQWKFVYYSLSMAVVLSMSFVITTFSFDHFTNSESTPQDEAIAWIQENVDEDEKIIIDQSAFLKLRDPDGKYYRDADWFWKVEIDSEIRNGKYNDDWREADYILATHEFLKQINENQLPFVREALDHSDIVAQWGPLSDGTHLNLAQYISTNGDWAMVYKVRDDEQIIQDDIWNWYRGQFIQSYGQVVDPYQNGRTTSSGQANAMLRAVWMDDPATFDGVWSWTKDHLQFRQEDKLISRLWEKGENDEYGITDSGVSTDADTDVAMALLFAYKKWGSASYLVEAKEIISDLWSSGVVRVGNQYYMGSSTRPDVDQSYLINPSSFSPAAYRMFSEVDESPTHEWDKLVDSGYRLLEGLRNANSSGTALPPNWIAVDQNSGIVRSAVQYVEKDANVYGFDAFRVFYRIAQDAAWYDEKRAFDYLENFTPFMQDQWSKEEIFTLYTKDGVPRSNIENIATDMGVLSVLSNADPVLAKDFYDRRVVPEFNEDGYWGDPDDLYGQTWAWFGSALFKNDLPNLWTFKKVEQRGEEGLDARYNR